MNPAADSVEEVVAADSEMAAADEAVMAVMAVMAAMADKAASADAAAANGEVAVVDTEEEEAGAAEVAATAADEGATEVATDPAAQASAATGAADSHWHPSQLTAESRRTHDCLAIRNKRGRLSLGRSRPLGVAAMSQYQSLLAPLTAIILATLASTSRAQTGAFSFTVIPATSSASWDASFAAPFRTGTNPVTNRPFSYLIGDWDTASNPTGTRTLTGFFGGDPGTNVPITISSGGVAASGNSGASPLRPSGAWLFRLRGGTIQVEDFSINLLDEETVNIGSNISFTYSTFRTRQPTCTVFGGFPISLPLGSIEVTQLFASQFSPAATGILTPTGPNTYSFSIPIDVVVEVQANFQNAPVAIPSTPAIIILSGSLTVAGNAASSTSGFLIDLDQTQPDSVAFDPFPFAEPLCGGSLLVNVTIGAQTFSVNANASLVGAGQRTCSYDFNQDENFDLVDAQNMAQVAVGLRAADPSWLDGDFNGDENFDLTDAQQVAQAVVTGICL